jgi:hypothetical protein
MLGSSLRVWNFRSRQIVSTIRIPSAAGFIDVQLIPRDREARTPPEWPTTRCTL